MKQLMYDVGNLFFPNYCPVCGLPLAHKGEIICLSCESRMPRTNYSLDPENPVSQIFWGRCVLSGATSLFRFEKGSKYQPLLHLLKYKGRKDIGQFLGRLLAIDLKDSQFKESTCIIPVPLHPKKQRKRGFNQSTVISEGINKILEIPIKEGVLRREQFTSTQTRKSKYERWENMEQVFALNEDAELYGNEKVLLIDDVVTTGATIEACVNQLRQIKGLEVYVATIACA